MQKVVNREGIHICICIPCQVKSPAAAFLADIMKQAPEQQRAVPFSPYQKHKQARTTT